MNDRDREFARAVMTGHGWCHAESTDLGTRMLMLLGSDGYSNENLFEKRNRDVQILDIWEGTGQIHRKIISGQVFQRRTALSNNVTIAFPVGPSTGTAPGGRGRFRGTWPVTPATGGEV